jgi:hypothetical protein
VQQRGERYRKRLRQSGFCVRCGKGSKFANFTCCRECLDREKQRSFTPRKRWTSARFNASKKGIIWQIKFDDYCKLISENCRYCELPINTTGIGLDRKDSSLGYLLENVVPCCFICNTVKNAFLSFEDMLIVGKVIKRRKLENQIQSCKKCAPIQTMLEKTSNFIQLEFST